MRINLTPLQPRDMKRLSKSVSGRFYLHQLCINGPVFDQVTTLSKFLNMGMPLADVIAASTNNASKILTRPDIGNLRPGSAGDAAILSISNGDYEFTDSTGKTENGEQRITAAGVVLGGQWWHSAETM